MSFLHSSYGSFIFNPFFLNKCKKKSNTKERKKKRSEGKKGRKGPCLWEVSQYEAVNQVLSQTQANLELNSSAIIYELCTKFSHLFKPQFFHPQSEDNTTNED